MIVATLLAAAVLLAPATAPAQIALPPGFTAQVYVTGEGFNDGRAVTGIPSTSTIVLDGAGTLYAARTGRRYIGGEVEDLWPIYRFAAGGGRMTRESEGRFLYGPPLPNPQVAAVRGGELLVTTFDRDRAVGVLYRVVDGRAELLAGGTPPSRLTPPLLKQPEGVAVDADGNILLADRQRDTVLRFDATGRLLDPRWLALPRPRLVVARGERLWIAGDGDADAPWQRGTGEIWSVGPQGRRLALRGPIAAGMDATAAGSLFVADRQRARLIAVGTDATTVDFATFAEGDAPRTLAFAPVTEATRRAGIAGDLFVAVIRRGTWALNEIIRISGPFDDYVRTNK
jgi:DNA-binding beta-propeller fold protein YncE